MYWRVIKSRIGRDIIFEGREVNQVSFILNRFFLRYFLVIVVYGGQSLGIKAVILDRGRLEFCFERLRGESYRGESVKFV